MSDSNTKITEQLDKLYTGKLKPITEGKKPPTHTYGEITRNGVNTILSMFGSVFTEDAVFYDLGCGFGRMLAHVAIEKKMKKVCGIEFDQGRAEWASKNFENFEYAGAKPEIIIGDMFEQDLSDATIVYFDNTVYPTKALDFFKTLPSGCLFIYKSYGIGTGDSFFNLETTYNRLPGRPLLENDLHEFWFTRASWRINVKK